MKEQDKKKKQTKRPHQCSNTGKGNEPRKPSKDRIHLYFSRFRQKGKVMTERDVFIQNIPKIAESVIEIQKMTPEQHEGFKHDYLEFARNTMPKVLEFTEKVLITIEACLQEEGAV